MKHRFFRHIALILLAVAGCISARAQVNAEQMIRVGQNALYFEDYVLSIQYFNQAITAKPYLAQPNFLRAIAKINLDDYLGAEEDAAEAIERNPFIADAYEVRGVARQNRGELRLAIDDYNHALLLLPRNRQLMFNKALAQQGVGDADSARITFDQLLADFPGFENGIDGTQLMNTMKAQAVRLGADLRNGIVTSADLSERPFKVVVDGEKEILAETLIIATGATAKYLGLPSETKFKGLGVSACATCDGFFYRKKTVAVVGGGDTACEEATYLAGLCKKVYMIVRRDVLRASQAMQERVMSTENIEILWNCNTQEVLGDDYGVTGARLVRKDGEVFDIALDGFFLAIGHHPNSELFSQWVNVDKEGYIITDGRTSKTNVEGVFAAGDVQDPLYRQAITAAASGCRAALDAEKFLKMK